MTATASMPSPIANDVFAILSADDRRCAAALQRLQALAPQDFPALLDVLGDLRPDVLREVLGPGGLDIICRHLAEQCTPDVRRRAYMAGVFHCLTPEGLDLVMEAIQSCDPRHITRAARDAAFWSARHDHPSTCAVADVALGRLCMIDDLGARHAVQHLVAVAYGVSRRGGAQEHRA